LIFVDEKFESLFRCFATQMSSVSAGLDVLVASAIEKLLLTRAGVIEKL
jgi:hypothetical protein